MCLYCMVGDMMGQFQPPPWPNYPYPYQSHPFAPTWPRDQVKEMQDILERIKALEDARGCPCEKEQNKPDYLAIIKDALEKLEKERQSYGQ